MTTLIGHDHAMQQVRDAFASGRMHHAWLLTGIEGIGKAALAQRIADHVLSGGQNPLGPLDRTNRTTKLILAEAHPDLLTVRRSVDEKTGAQRNVIVVDDALRVAAFLRKTSTHGGWRVVLVDEAHRLNRNGQNAILKILEEPPQRALIVLTATMPGALLPTIRSRCRSLSLAPLDEQAMRAILAQAAPRLEPDAVAELLQLAGGSAGFALKIVETEVLPLYTELKSLLAQLPKFDLPRVHKLADQISRKADAESYEVLTSLLVERLRLDVAALAEAGIGGTRIRAGLERWDRTRATLATAEHSNLDKKLAFVNALSDIQAAVG